MGDDDVLLHRGEAPAQGPGILQRSHRMGEALIAVVGGLVPGVIEIEVMEQPRSGRGPVVQAPAAGQTEGYIGHKDRMFIAGGAGVMGQRPHGLDFGGVQKVPDTVYETADIDVIVHDVPFI